MEKGHYRSLGTTFYKIKWIEESFVRLTTDGIYESSQDDSEHWKDSPLN